MAPRSIPTATRPLSAKVQAVPSKSVTHRALVAAAIRPGDSEVVGPLDADDTRVTREGLVDLGFDVRRTHRGWSVRGGAGRVPGGGRLWLGESGTSFRFLLALAAMGQRPSHLDGAPRLRERPVGELVEALRTLGAHIEGPRPGVLPLTAGGEAMHGGTVHVRGGRSSQFASALLLAGGGLSGGVELTVEPPVVSRPYIDLTAQVMRGLGFPVTRHGDLRWSVAAADASPVTFTVEGDHSAASYFLAAAALVGGTVRVEGLRPDSLQPDARLGGLLAALGARIDSEPAAVTVTGDGDLPGFEVNLADAPDLVPTMAALALFAAGESHITGVPHLRIKESDRLELLAHNLGTLGRDARSTADGLHVGAKHRPRGGTVRTGGDHRIAMAFALAGLRQEGVTLDDWECVAKSNPSFFNVLRSL